MYEDALCGKHIDIRNGAIRVRSVAQEDLPRMLAWLTDARVLEFYGGQDLHYNADTLRAHYTELWDTVYYRAIIGYMGEPVGYCQVYRLDGAEREEYGYTGTEDTVFAMDQFLGVPELWGHGIGTVYLDTILAYLEAEEQAEVVLVDPHTDNARAIRAYEKAGFKAESILPAHELFEGRRVDCLLMAHRARP